MIDGSEKRNRQLAFELQNSHVCEKRSKVGKLKRFKKVSSDLKTILKTNLANLRFLSFEKGQACQSISYIAWENRLKGRTIRKVMGRGIFEPQEFVFVIKFLL